MRAVKTIQFPIASTNQKLDDARMAKIEKQRRTFERELDRAVNNGFDITHVTPVVIDSIVFIIYTLQKDDESKGEK
jgi:predicted ATPase